MRKIYIIGEINEEAFKSFCEQMDEFEKESKLPVLVVLNSLGGNALDAIAFSERIRLSRCVVNVTVCGLAASAAVLILASGQHRRITKNSWLMVHEDIGTYKNIKTTDLAREALQARDFETQWNKLLSDFTHVSAAHWQALHERGDLYLTPDECLKLGIVDEII